MSFSFAVAFFLPWIYTELGCIITLILNPSCYDPEYYLVLGIEKRQLYRLPVIGIISGVFGSFAAFGEEGGWRGYMMPKLMKLMPKGSALIVGGIIWGLWHAPLTLIGHNFGTEYPGYPWLGIVFMCMNCILLGIVLTFVTEKTGSVWPAVFIHGINNANPSILNGYINPEKDKLIFGVNGMWIGLLISLLFTAVVVLVMLRKKEPVS